jgi:dolichol-phosphate mannosyltransferase
MTSYGKISLIIPVYNEADIIRTTLEKLQKEYVGLNIEIVISDDGSSDNTKQLAQDFFFTNEIGFVIGSHHMGKGSAITYGILSSTGVIIILSAADIVIKREMMQEILLKISEYDMILLSKNHHRSRLKNRSFARRILSLSYNFLVRRLFGLPFTDTQGVKIIRHDVLINLLNYCHDKSFVLDLELVVFARKLGYSILEYPWSFEFRSGSKTVFKTIPRILINTLKLWITN